MLTDAEWISIHKQEEGEKANPAEKLKTLLGEHFDTCRTLFAYQGVVYTVDSSNKVEPSWLFSKNYSDKVPNQLVKDILPAAAPDDFVLRAIAAAAGHRLA